eukprot:3780071-Pleurochrysis_carterae.AAC.1
MSAVRRVGRPTLSRLLAHAPPLQPSAFPVRTAAAVPLRPPRAAPPTPSLSAAVTACSSSPPAGPAATAARAVRPSRGGPALRAPAASPRPPQLPRVSPPPALREACLLRPPYRAAAAVGGSQRVAPMPGPPRAPRASLLRLLLAPAPSPLTSGRRWRVACPPPPPAPR